MPDSLPPRCARGSAGAVKLEELLSHELGIIAGRAIRNGLPAERVLEVLRDGVNGVLGEALAVAGAELERPEVTP